MKRVSYFQLSIRFWDVEGSSTSALPQDILFPLAHDLLGGTSLKKKDALILSVASPPLTLSCLVGIRIGHLLAGVPSGRRSFALLTPYLPG